MLLKNKNAVIYGAGGAVGGAVARAFAAKGRMYSSPAARSQSSMQSPRRFLPQAAQLRRRL